MEKRIAKIEEHIVTINHELGIVIGQLDSMKWLIRGTFLAVVGKIVYDILIT